MSLCDVIYTVEIHDIIAHVTAEFKYQNNSDDDHVVCFNFPRRLNETAYNIYQCEATLGIQMLTSVPVTDEEVVAFIILAVQPALVKTKTKQKTSGQE